MNEVASILLLLIVSTWFFTSKNFAAFYQVLVHKDNTIDPNAPNSAGYTPEEKKQAQDFEKKDTTEQNQNKTTLPGEAIS